jgi:hypothetical protein
VQIKKLIISSLSSFSSLSSLSSRSILTRTANHRHQKADRDNGSAGNIHFHQNDAGNRPTTETLTDSNIALAQLRNCSVMPEQTLKILSQTREACHPLICSIVDALNETALVSF